MNDTKLKSQSWISHPVCNPGQESGPCMQTISAHTNLQSSPQTEPASISSTKSKVRADRGLAAGFFRCQNRRFTPGHA